MGEADRSQGRADGDRSMSDAVRVLGPESPFSNNAKPKTRKKRATAVAGPNRGAGSADGEPCPRSDLCSKQNHHLGRCDTKLATREDE